MGFGLLLIGYFTASIMALNSLGGVFRLVGSIIICKGSKKLSQYHNSFYILWGVAIAMTALSCVFAVSDVSDFLQKHLLISEPLIGGGLAEAIPYVKMAADFALVAAMCYSVRKISKDTGAVKTTYTPIRNFFFYCIFCVIQLVLLLAVYTENSGLVAFAESTALPVWMVIVNLLCVVLNCIMLFSCYARICDENDVDMPQKPSRFEFVNRMRAEREEKRRGYIKEAEETLKGAPSPYSPEQTARAEAAERAKKKGKHK